MPPHHGHHAHHGGQGRRFSNSPGAYIYASGPSIWDAPIPICYETKDGITKQVLCPVPAYNLGDPGTNFGDGTTDLWTALHNLAAKIPAANPGPQPGATVVTQQMLNALGAVAGSIPGIPSDVATALRLLPYGAALLSPSQQAQVADVIKAAAPTLARVVNAYASVAHAGTVALPSGTIASYENGVWRVAVPKGSPGFAGDLGIIGPGAALVAGSYTDVGTSPTMPPNATPVTPADFKKATSTPFYKAWWFWTPVGVVAVGTVGYFAFRKKRRK